MAGLLERLKSNKDDARRDEYYWRIRRHRRLILYRVTGIIIALAVVGCALYISYLNKEYTDYDIASDEDRRDSEDAQYVPYNGNVIKYSRDGAEAFDGRNNALWNITFEMQNPRVATCKGYAALGDFKGNMIYVISAEGQIGEIETKIPITTFCVSSQGVVAAVLEDEGSTKINLYSPESELLAEMKCTMTRSGYPIDISLSEDGMKLAVSYIRVDNGEMKSSVAFYNFDEVGQNEIDNYVSGYDYVDCVIPKVRFLDNETAFALGDSRLVFYKGAQKPVSISDILIDEEVRSVYCGENKVALVFRDTDNAGGYRVDVYGSDGQLDMRKSIDMAYTDMVIKKDRMIVYNDTECEMYKYNGRKKYQGGFKESMLLLVPGDSLTKWTLVNRDTVQSVRLR
ncbi:MAG: hypothetical protein IKR68_03065 [Lachnospiraceae bacterium]|nr:hypothetical protein [Lachnospiraceae bacterium]